MKSHKHKELANSIETRKNANGYRGSAASARYMIPKSLGRRLALCGLAITLATAGISASAYAAELDGDGQAPSGQGQQGGPDGSTPPSMPGGDGSGQQPGGQPGGGGAGGANTMSFDYSGTYSGAVTADGTETTSAGETISATEADQNTALAQNGGTLTVTSDTLQKSGDDTNGDNCNFYGLNSILLAVGEGSMAYISDSSLSATSEGSNGIFATDSGTVYANNDTISTTAGNSRGLDATYNGTIVANQMTIDTQGDHCAGVATDRGGGNISLTNSTINTAGSGSPVLYSTGDIEVDGITGTSTGSQISGMEGLNTIMISNSTLTSTQTDKTASDPIADGVIIYQSTSGDAESTTGEAALFQAVNSTLSSAIQSGAMFYSTNTTANIVLSNTTLDFDSTNANLLQVEGNDSNNWGTAGSNGATVNFTGISQTLNGNVTADSISTADIYLLQNSSWTGASSITSNASATQTAEDNITVNVDGTSTWTVTGDSTVTNLNVAEGGQVVDASGNQVNIVDASGNTLVSGTSSITVTVLGSYGTTIATTDANEIQNPNIDRTAFDSYYGTSTAFGTNSASSSELASAIDAILEELSKDMAATA